MNVLTRFQSFRKSRKGGILTLLLGVLATVIWVQLQGGSFSGYGQVDGGQLSVHPRTGVKLQASLTQPMIVQGADGTVYLDLSVVTPETLRRDFLRVPTDTIVVLDRSGSMGEDNKWQYATQAVHSLLDRLMRKDRIALITFDSGARVQSGLIEASEKNIQHFRDVVNSLSPGASTNLGEALLRAENIAGADPSSERRRRVILLSDGHANTGIVDPAELGVIAKRIADRGSVVSTVGMGLGFNETLMASLADQGMGSFSYRWEPSLPRSWPIPVTSTLMVRKCEFISPLV
jgi:Ca-activated chloride channel homolog